MCLLQNIQKQLVPYSESSDKHLQIVTCYVLKTKRKHTFNFVEKVSGVKKTLALKETQDLVGPI